MPEYSKYINLTNFIYGTTYVLNKVVDCGGASLVGYFVDLALTSYADELTPLAKDLCVMGATITAQYVTHLNNRFTQATGRAEAIATLKKKYPLMRRRSALMSPPSSPEREDLETEENQSLTGKTKNCCAATKAKCWGPITEWVTRKAVRTSINTVLSGGAGVLFSYYQPDSTYLPAVTAAAYSATDVVIDAGNKVTNEIYNICHKPR